MIGLLKYLSFAAVLSTNLGSIQVSCSPIAIDPPQLVKRITTLEAFNISRGGHHAVSTNLETGTETFGFWAALNSGTTLPLSNIIFTNAENTDTAARTLAFNFKGLNDPITVKSRTNGANGVMTTEVSTGFTPLDVKINLNGIDSIYVWVSYSVANGYYAISFINYNGLTIGTFNYPRPASLGSVKSNWIWYGGSVSTNARLGVDLGCARYA
ncbi:hypothetical protein ABW20_dc0109791 [Dactylellina cionopaga]|nr:hypothetical protein ABW20_dc0109791 [Dactylellina cionopaga]